jgi:hypothetical protein
MEYIKNYMVRNAHKSYLLSFLADNLLDGFIWLNDDYFLRNKKINLPKN